LGARITKDGNCEPEINDGINKGRAAITRLNGILWDRDVTPKTKTHIYHAIVKSTITYAAETWCSKAKTTANTIPQKWTSGDAQLVFPRKTKL
jgi:hypothetical protein